MSEDRDNLITVVFRGSRPSRQDIALKLGIDVDEIDPAFGVIPIDKNGKYAIRVLRSLPDSSDSVVVEGPFADPEIDHF